MPNDEGGDSEVGYGKPPLKSRFRKGQSGNPKGRPRGARNLSTLLDNALNEKVTVKEVDRRMKISKREAMVKQLANKAASGYHRSIQLPVTLLQQLEARREASDGQASNFEEGDLAIIEGILERIKAT